MFWIDDGSLREPNKMTKTKIHFIKICFEKQASCLHLCF